MKKLIAALIVAAAFAVPCAEATFFPEVLTPGSDITVVGSYDVFVTGEMAAMTVFYVKGNKLDVAGILTVGDAGGQITLPLANPIDRVIIQVDTRGLPTSSFVALVSQGGVNKGQITVNREGQLVFDVAP